MLLFFFLFFFSLNCEYLICWKQIQANKRIKHSLGAFGHPTILWEYLFKKKKKTLQTAGYRFTFYRWGGKNVFKQALVLFISGTPKPILKCDYFVCLPAIMRVSHVNYPHVVFPAPLSAREMSKIIDFELSKEKNRKGKREPFLAAACCALKVHGRSLGRETAVNCHSRCHLQLSNSLLTSQLNC